jgi:hypothetical protein
MPSSVQDAIDLTGAGLCLKWKYISGTCNGNDSVDGAQVRRESSIVRIRSENQFCESLYGVRGLRCKKCL